MPKLFLISKVQETKWIPEMYSDCFNDLFEVHDPTPYNVQLNAYCYKIS